MPSGRYFTFFVDIGGKKQKEYTIDDKDVIAVSLHGKDSFFVEESEHEVEGDSGQYQKYPVLPFKIVIKKYYSYPCWFEIYVDGEHVRSFPIVKQGEASRTVDGYKVKNEIRELAFSLPRISLVQTLTKQRQIQAGTVCVVCREAIPSHTETFRKPRAVQRNELPDTTMYPQLTKKDMSSVQGGMGVVCREGRTMVELQYDDKCTYHRRTRVSKGPFMEEVVLHYGTREVLQDMGLSVEREITAQEVTTRLTNIDINNCTEQDKNQPLVADKAGKPNSNDSPPKSTKGKTDKADKPTSNDSQPKSVTNKAEKAGKPNSNDSQPKSVTNKAEKAGKPNSNDSQPKSVTNKAEKAGKPHSNDSQPKSVTNKAEKAGKPNSNDSHPKSVTHKTTLNVETPDNLVNQPESGCPLPMDQSKDVKQEQIHQFNNDLEVHSPCKKIPRLMKQDQSMSPTAIKHERLKKEAQNQDLVEVGCEVVEMDDDDDDVVYIETTFIKREPGSLDDSIICMGDDSCCELDIPEPEISILDLCDDD